MILKQYRKDGSQVEAVNKKFKNYQKELQEINAELATLPEGSLRKKQGTYFQAIGRKLIGITKKPAVIKQLARKKYLLARKIQIENLFLQKPGEYDLLLPQELIVTLPPVYRELPITYFHHPHTADWVAKVVVQNSLYLENAKYHYNGVDFRSMSERMIAEQLTEYGLPYRYDSVLNLIHRSISPDFVVKNPFNGHTVIWEHFGAFNTEKYADLMNDKMDAILKQGFVEGVDLIVTFQYHLRNLARIQKLIRAVIF